MDWRNKNVFLKDEKITDMSSPRLSPNEVRNIVYDLQKFTNYGKACIIPEYKVTHNWTKRSIFWDLPYWKDNLLQHDIDSMHIDYEASENIPECIAHSKIQKSRHQTLFIPEGKVKHR